MTTAAKRPRFVFRPAPVRLVQAVRGGDVAEPGPSGKPRLADPHGVELALNVASPEFQEPAQFGEIRSDIELLPDEALQQVGMIGQMIDDLRRRQAIIAKALLVVAHCRAHVRYALS